MPAHPIVVMIDDDENDLFFLQRVIAKSGAMSPTMAFQDPVDAQAYFAKQARCAPEFRANLAAIFCDIKMPRMDGFEFLSWLRGTRQFEHVPFYMVSSSPRPEDTSRAMALGAREYLLKFPPTERIQAILSIR